MAETVLITGASGGIGEALATLFAKDKCRLLLVARSGGRLEEIAADLSSSFGVDVLTLPCDLSDPEAVEGLCGQIARRGIKVDILVNNAGFGLHGEAAAIDRQRQLNMLDLNVRALTDLTLRFLPAMLERGRGGVMQIASIAGLAPGPWMAGYFASKAYVVSFSRALAREVEGSGVTVTTVLPGPTRTGFQSRSGMPAHIFRKGAVMSADAVAEEAYRAFRAGRSKVTTGAANRLLGAMMKLSPERITSRVISRMQGPGGR